MHTENEWELDRYIGGLRKSELKKKFSDEILILIIVGYKGATMLLFNEEVGLYQSYLSTHSFGENGNKKQERLQLSWKCWPLQPGPCNVVSKTSGR